MRTVNITAGHDVKIVTPAGEQIVIGVSRLYNREPETYVYLVARNNATSNTWRMDKLFTRVATGNPKNY